MDQAELHSNSSYIILRFREISLILFFFNFVIKLLIYFFSFIFIIFIYLFIFYFTILY